MNEGSADELSIDSLMYQLTEERGRRQKLEEECDLLAQANQDLVDQVKMLQHQLSSLPSSTNQNGHLPIRGNDSNFLLEKNGLAPRAPPGPNESANIAVEEAYASRPLLVNDGGDKYCQSARLVIPDACGGMNPLSVVFVYPPPEIDGDTHTPGKKRCGSLSDSTRIACAGVDKEVTLYSLEGAKLNAWRVGAPVLALATCNGILAGACMDGTTFVLDTTTAETGAMNLIPQSLQKHDKWAVGVEFSSDGSCLATLSHDCTVNMYRRSQQTSWSPTDDSSNHKMVPLYYLVAKCTFQCTPECMVFAPVPEIQSDDGSDGNTTERSFRLLVATRDSVYLKSVFMSCGKRGAPQVSDLIMLNEKCWDSHVSITPLHLSLSPDNRHLLVCTEKDVHFVLDTSYLSLLSDTDIVQANDTMKERRSKRLALLCGHNSGSFPKPAASWSADGNYTYSNSDNDSAVLAHHLPQAVDRAPAGTAPIARLHGLHKGIVRALCTHRDTNLVLTASYDHSVVLWE